LQLLTPRKSYIFKFFVVRLYYNIVFVFWIFSSVWILPKDCIKSIQKKSEQYAIISNISKVSWFCNQQRSDIGRDTAYMYCTFLFLFFQQKSSLLPISGISFRSFSLLENWNENIFDTFRSSLFRAKSFLHFENLSIKICETTNVFSQGLKKIFTKF
jgi:hypothetical protein